MGNKKNLIVSEILDKILDHKKKGISEKIRPVV